MLETTAGARSMVGEDMTADRRSSRFTAIGSFVWMLLAAGATAALTWMLGLFSGHVFSGNSDGATVVLEGQSMSAGHLLLQGWGLSRDSFWSIDAVFYAIYVALDGVQRSALHIVPGLIAALAIVLGTWFIAAEERNLRALAGVAILVLILGVPNPVLSFFLLQGPWHVGTALWSLVAFAGLSSGRWRLGWVLSTVALCAGLLGDLETIPFGVVPVVLAGFVEMGWRRSWRHGLPSITAGLAASGLAWALRAFVRHEGGFSIASGITQAVSNRYGANIGHAFTWMTGMFGVTKLAIGPARTISRDAQTNGSTLSHIVHAPLLLITAAALAAALAAILRAIVTGRPGRDRTVSSMRIDSFLVFGIAGSIASFIVLCPNDNADYARYLTSAVICGSVLAARSGTRWMRWIHGGFAHVSVVFVMALVACGVGLTAANDLSKPAAPTDTAALAIFLESHHLTLGVGDYWSASIVTVASSDRVVVRPVITRLGGAIVRYDRQSTASWYAGVPFQFLVYNVRHPWRDIDATTAITTFGRPKIGYDVGDYRVIVWPHPIHLSPKGFTRG